MTADLLNRSHTAVSQPLDMAAVNWADIDTVLLDMDGTILDLKFDNLFWMQLVPERWGQQNGLAVEQALAHLAPIFQAHMGTLQWYCLDYWADQLQLDVVALKRELQHEIGYLKDAEQFLQAVVDAGKRLVLVTNAHRQSLNLKIEHTGLDQYFDCLVSAHDDGLARAKEQPGFWELLQQQLGYQPQRSLFADDNESVLKCAAASGLTVRAVLAGDSRKPARQDSAWPGVHNLADLLPI